MNRPDDEGSDLAARIERLEDIEQICRLKAAYCAACDDDHNGATVVGLLTSDGTWSTTLGTTCADPAETREYFDSIRASGRMRYSTHMVTNPVVEVDGDRAVGTWSFAMMYTDDQARRFRILGFYRDEFAKTDGTWKFTAIASTVQDYVELAVETELPTPAPT